MIKNSFKVLLLSALVLPLQGRSLTPPPAPTSFVINKCMNLTSTLVYLFSLTKNIRGNVVNSHDTLALEQSNQNSTPSLATIEENDALVIIIGSTKQFLLVRRDNKLFVSDLTGFARLSTDYRPSNLIEQTDIKDTQNITIIIEDGSLQVK